MIIQVTGALSPELTYLRASALVAVVVTVRGLRGRSTSPKRAANSAIAPEGDLV